MHTVHAEITHEELVYEPQFPIVAAKLQTWLQEKLQGKTGVLVSHNTSVDIQFLLCEYIRADIQLPSGIKLGLDTMTTLKRFSSVCYRKAPLDQWPELTKTGKASMGVKPCATYALSKREPPELFADVCGDHHDADADTRAVAVIVR